MRPIVFHPELCPLVFHWIVWKIFRQFIPHIQAGKFGKNSNQSNNKQNWQNLKPSRAEKVVNFNFVPSKNFSHLWKKFKIHTTPIWHFLWIWNVKICRKESKVKVIVEKKSQYLNVIGFIEDPKIQKEASGHNWKVQKTLKTNKSKILDNETKHKCGLRWMNEYVTKIIE